MKGRGSFAGSAGFRGVRVELDAGADETTGVAGVLELLSPLRRRPPRLRRPVPDPSDSDGAEDGAVGVGRERSLPFAAEVARRLTGPRTGVRSRKTQPTPGTGFPPMSRPSSKSQGCTAWSSWKESLESTVAPT